MSWTLTQWNNATVKPWHQISSSLNCILCFIHCCKSTTLIIFLQLCPWFSNYIWYRSIDMYICLSATTWTHLVQYIRYQSTTRWGLWQRRGEARQGKARQDNSLTVRYVGFSNLKSNLLSRFQSILLQQINFYICTL